MDPSLTVVVCCADDTDIYYSIASVDDPDSDVVASITPNHLIEEWLTNRRIRFAITPLGNHAVTTNAGIELARTDSVLIIDSDTVLTPGTIAATRRALNYHDVVNLRIGFAARDTRLSRAIARLRDFDNTYDSPAYKPGIAFRLKIKEQLGGFWYDDRVAWPCDAELLNRLKKASISIHHLDGIGLVHRPVALGHVLKAYFHYGIGDAQQMFEIGHNTHWWPTRNLSFRYRSAVRAAKGRMRAQLLLILATVDLASLLGIGREGVRIRRRRARVKRRRVRA